MKVSFYFSWIILLGCNNHHKNKINSDIVDDCIHKDTITSQGTKIHYIKDGDKFKISWGDGTYTRTYDSIYSCVYDSTNGNLWNLVPEYKSETKNYLIFTNTYETSSGGNPAPLDFMTIVLPKNIKDSSLEIPFFINCIGDNLVYNDYQNEKIHVLNLETKKDQIFLLSPKPALSRSPTMSIKETKIENGNFYIKYESLNKKDSLVDIIETYKITQ